MKLHRRPISKHQRARLIAWTLAMLMWMASVFMGAAFTPRHERQRAERMSLEFLKWRVKALIISRAVDFISVRWRSAQGRSSKLKAGHIRAVVGARICRLLNHKDVLACVRALLNVLLNLDAHAKAVAKRMKRGLSRRMPYRRPSAREEAMPVRIVHAAISFDSS